MFFIFIQFLQPPKYLLRQIVNIVFEWPLMTFVGLFGETKLSRYYQEIESVKVEMWHLFL